MGIRIGAYDDVDPDQLTMFVAWVTVFTLCIGVTNWLLFHLRGRYNIAARGPIVSLLTQNTLLGTFMGSSSASLFPTPSCGLWVGVVSMHLNALALMFVLRGWVLLFRSRIAHKLAEYSMAKNTTLADTAPDAINSPERVLLEGPGSFFIRHRHWMLGPYLVRTYFIALTPLVVIPVTFMSLVNKLDCDARIWATSLYSGTTVGFWATVVIMIALLLYKQEQDAFGIKTEFAFAAAVAVIVTIIEGAFSLPWKSPIAAVAIINSGIFIGWLRITVKPLFDARRFADDTVNFAGIRDVATLEDLLSIDIGFKSFMDYSKREFAQENVLFWKAVKDFHDTYGQADYRALTQREQCMNAASAIMKQYIVDNAPSQVNLPAEVRNNLIAAYDDELARKADAPSHSRAPSQQSPQLQLQLQPLVSGDGISSPLASGAPSPANRTPTPTHRSVESNSSSSSHSPHGNNNANAPPTLVLRNSQADVRLSQPSLHVNTVNPTPLLADQLSSHPVSAVSAKQLLNNEYESRLITSLMYHKETTSAGTTGVTLTHSVVALFLPAVKEVYQLMTGDLLPRYIRSREFAQFVQEMKDRTSAHPSHVSHPTAGGNEKKTSKKSKSKTNKSKSKGIQASKYATKLKLKSPSSSAQPSSADLQGLEMAGLIAGGRQVESSDKAGSRGGGGGVDLDEDEQDEGDEPDDASVDIGRASLGGSRGSGSPGASAETLRDRERRGTHSKNQQSGSLLNEEMGRGSLGRTHPPVSSAADAPVLTPVGPDQPAPTDASIQTSPMHAGDSPGSRDGSSHGRSRTLDTGAKPNGDHSPILSSAPAPHHKASASAFSLGPSATSTPTHPVRVSLTLGLTARPLDEDLVALRDIVVDPLSGSISAHVAPAPGETL